MKTRFGICLLAALLALAGCSETALPQELSGSYAAADERYEGCYLELEPGRLSYRTVDGDVLHHRIGKVHRENVPDGTLYRVTYLGDDGRDAQLAFSYRAHDHTLTLANRPDITWARTRP